MERKAIGFKAEYSMLIVVLMVLGGVVLAAAGIMFFLFVMAGAIGGAITGGTVAGGIGLAVYGVRSKTLPSELVHIDENTVYLPKTSISISQIKTVTVKGKAITITPLSGKRIMQGLIANSDECCQQILNAMQPKNA